MIRFEKWGVSPLACLFLATLTYFSMSAAHAQRLQNRLMTAQERKTFEKRVEAVQQAYRRRQTGLWQTEIGARRSSQFFQIPNDYLHIFGAATTGDEYAVVVQTARLLYEEGKYKEAVSEYEAARKISPKNAPGDELADALAASGDVEAAITAYQTYLWRDVKSEERDMVEGPNWHQEDGSSLARYAALLFRARRYPEAHQAYQWASQRIISNTIYGENFFATLSLSDIAPDDLRNRRTRFVSATQTLIALTNITDRTATAPEVTQARELEKAIAARPTFALAHFFLGRAYSKTAPYWSGGNDEIAEYWDKAEFAYKNALRFGNDAVKVNARDGLAEMFTAKEKYYANLKAILEGKQE